jgi:hypothetical protein
VINYSAELADAQAADLFSSHPFDEPPTAAEAADSRGEGCPEMVAELERMRCAIRDQRAATTKPDPWAHLPGWTLRWLDRELAERDVPCQCGHAPERHRDTDSDPHFAACADCRDPDDPDSCAAYVPDRERLCDACRGHGADPLYEHAPDCRDCGGVGWVE